MSEIVINKQSAAKLHEHVRELFFRFLFSALSLLVVGIGVYFFYEPILNILRAPLNAPLYYNSPIGSFSFVMKVCFMGALTITIPVIIYNLIMFVQPAFEGKLTKKRVYLFSSVSSILAISGAIFAYIFILPGSLKFFAGFQVDGLNALISADNYLGFVTNIISTFVLIFQLPLIMFFIDSIKPFKPNKLWSFEKWVVIGSLVVALITPFTFDFLTSLLIAVPIIVLYNLTVIAILTKRFTQKVRSARMVKAQIVPGFTNKEFIANATINDLQISSIIDELPKPDIIVEPIKPVAPTIQKTYRDIRLVKNITQPVQPAAWVIDRKNRQQLINKNVRVFSDISRPISRTI